VHAGEKDHARPGWTTSRSGQDPPSSDRGRLKNRTVLLLLLFSKLGPLTPGGTSSGLTRRRSQRGHKCISPSQVNSFQTRCRAKPDVSPPGYDTSCMRLARHQSVLWMKPNNWLPWQRLLMDRKTNFRLIVYSNSSTKSENLAK